jgi:hypothetical protein
MREEDTYPSHLIELAIIQVVFHDVLHKSLQGITIRRRETRRAGASRNTTSISPTFAQLTTIVSGLLLLRSGLLAMVLMQTALSQRCRLD